MRNFAISVKGNSIFSVARVSGEVKCETVHGKWKHYPTKNYTLWQRKIDASKLTRTTFHTEKKNNFQDDMSSFSLQPSAFTDASGFNVASKMVGVYA